MIISKVYSTHTHAQAQHYRNRNKSQENKQEDEEANQHQHTAPNVKNAVSLTVNHRMPITNKRPK